MSTYQLHRPSQVAEILQAHGLSMSRRLGQNFLIDANILGKVVEAAELSDRDNVIEIGAGIGTLTCALAPHVDRLVTIERDRKFIEVLQDTTAGFDNIVLIQGDAMDIGLADFIDANAVNKVVSNLPYNISKPVLRKVFDLREQLERAVLMLQKEVADRLVARPNTRDYGPLAIAAYLFAAVETIAIVSPNSFFPPPKVRSAIVRLKFLNQPRVPVDNEENLFAVVNGALQNRRKTVLNSLSASIAIDADRIRNALEDVNIDGGRRGETLTPEEFVDLSRALEKHGAF